nr:helix-turn-helix domain-containing protein [Sedimentitalea nanhaiensis]
MLLPLPSDPRLARLTTTVLPPPLGLLATRVGASEKTIGRIFKRETGMSYRQWRQQWRLMKAYEMLVAGASISMTAQDLGFASDSAFITFFKNLSGQTPKAFLKTPAGQIR